MNTLPLTRAYLDARQKILQREASDAMRRSLDNRATANSQREWKNMADYARTELAMVNAALAELSLEDSQQ